MALQFTPVNSIPGVVQDLRKAFATGKTRPLAWRKQQLHRLFTAMQEQEQAIIKATAADLRKPRVETILTEIGMIASDAVKAIEHLDAWAAPYSVDCELINKFDKPQIRYDPLGVVLIIGAWNYPFQLTFVPLVGAIAAGNCVVIKPSEVSPNSAKVVTDIVNQYLDTSCIKVVNGAVQETTAVLEQRFDHILYTGGSEIGKVIMAAAAKHLTPVTLELGGKSPAIIDKNVDITVAARRVAWGRLMNNGQTCIAPDYVLCHESIREQFVAELIKAITKYYGEDIKASPDLSRMVNGRHFQRVKKLLECKGAGKVVFGGQTDEKENYIAPTILLDPSPDSDIMTNEIFGPLLPVMKIKSIPEAIEFINAREKPLALYVFSHDKEVCNAVLNETSSGNAVVNDTLMHASVDTLPFGGVGCSGFGAYHGKHSFELFSHKKGLLFKDLGMEKLNNLRYPPYSDKKLNWLKWLLFKTPSSGGSMRRVALLLLVAVAVGYFAVSRGYKLPFM